MIDQSIQTKKGGGRHFHVHDDNISNSDHDHCMKVPRGDSTPTSIALANSRKMTLDRSDIQSQGSIVIRILERESPKEFSKLIKNE